MGGHEYTISGGRQDAWRLARQASVMGKSTDAFLGRLGLRPGWRCVDFGCGTGEVTLDLARAVGPHGRALGIDFDAEALDLARKAAEREALDATFVCADVNTPVEPGYFDLALARLVLSHLIDPMAALSAMWWSVRPGGIVAVEDIFTGTMRSDPPSPALARFQDIYLDTVRFHGADPTIGPRLPALLAAAQLEDVHEQTVTNPMTTIDQRMFLAGLLDNMRSAILEAGASTHPSSTISGRASRMRRESR